MRATAAEMALLRRLSQPGASVASVAHDMGITTNVAKKRLRKLYARLEVNNALQAWAMLERHAKAPKPRVQPPMDSIWHQRAPCAMRQRS